ncbi:peptidase S41 [Dyadobacter endophyticus]|uniref:Peptidase S41 n=1 Tax=Dyadobacter endophyticus TaxID=1749036 RepID=A0ABQ1YCF5_9BACT|nr:S41 family peptidase [Dyadobacter endophyticus]GGH21014.1 peptidase S41 [Dyadobacter endophyticus]
MKHYNLLLVTVPLLVLTIAIGGVAVAQKMQLTLTKEQAADDFKWLRRALEYAHPRLYKYDSKHTVDARFDSLGSMIQSDIKAIDFLSLVSTMNASVRCGHLYTIPQYELADEVLNKKVMPLYFKIIDKKLYVLFDCSDKSVQRGSQITSINGRTIDEILENLLPRIAADGYIHTRKIGLLERYHFRLFHGFDLYYHLHIDRSDSFKVEYIEHGSGKSSTAILNGLTFDERQRTLRERYNRDEQGWFTTPSPEFKINEKEKYATLTVPRSFYSKTDPNFDSLLSAAFARIKDLQIKNLILDLRNNEGGSEQQQQTLISYLSKRPFKLYQNIFLSHLDFRPLREVIIERDTSKLLFDNSDEYMRKLTETLWINNYDYDKSLQLQLPKKNAFEGQLYVLMNGVSFSSAADLIADIEKTTNTIFIGEESGGAYEGPTGGDNIVVQLPNSKIMVRISPNIHIGYKYRKHPIGRGVLPTHQINYSIKDVLSERDLEMEAAKNLITGKPN